MGKTMNLRPSFTPYTKISEQRLINKHEKVKAKFLKPVGEKRKKILMISGQENIFQRIQKAQTTKKKW